MLPPAGGGPAAVFIGTSGGLPRQRIGAPLEGDALWRGILVADATELRARQPIERPTFGAMIADRGRAIERALALAAVEGPEMSARERRVHDALAVDVPAARRVARHRHLVDFRQRRLGRV